MRNKTALQRSLWLMVALACIAERAPAQETEKVEPPPQDTLVERSAAPAKGESDEPPNDLEPPPRRKTRQQIFAAFGPVVITDNLTQSNSLQLNLAAAYTWDLEYAAIKALGDLSFAGIAPVMVDFGVGVNGYPMAGDQTPFAGGELGYGVVFPKGPGGVMAGFVLGALAGYQFFRETNLNFEVAFKVSMFARQVEGSWPFTYGLRLGVYF